MKPFGPYVAARTLFESAVRTMRGMDRLTGMPVLIYSLPQRVELPQLLHRRLVPYSDEGWEQGVPFVVAELPLHAVPAGDPLLAARGALEALIELHADGQVHGGLTPAQLWSVDGDVRLAGAGLPWEALGGGFDAPEGGKTPQADLYALGCSLEALGGVPDPLRPLLAPDPRARPSAREALTLLSRPYTAPSEPDPEAAPPEPGPESAADEVGELLSLFDEPPAAQPVTPPEEAAVVVIGTAPLEAPEPDPAPEGSAAETPAQVPPVAGSSAPQSPASGLEAPRPAPTVPTIRMGFESAASPSVRVVSAPPQPAVAPTPTAAEGAANPRQQPIRIGWEEDNSWRVVRSPEEEPPAVRPARPARWTWLAGAGLLALLLGLGWWRLGSAPAGVGPSCCQVQFQVSGGQQRVSISVLSAPGGSGLKRGDLIGAVPGSLQFPDARGAYTLQAEAEGYAPVQFQVTVPTRAPVEIDLKR